MKSFFAVALVASLTVAQDCDAYDWSADVWQVYDDCFYAGNQDTCQYICDNGSCDSWWFDSEISDACNAASAEPVPISDLSAWEQYDQCTWYGNMEACDYICENGHLDSWFWESEIEYACELANGPQNLGTLIRDGLESMDVDVDALISFLENKGYELEELQMQHEQEIMDFFEQAEIEAEPLFTDAAQKIAAGVAAQLQAVADSLVVPATWKKHSEQQRRSRRAMARRGGKRSARVQRQIDSGKTRTQVGVENAWDLWDDCVVDEDMTDCLEICQWGHLDSWFWDSEIETACVMSEQGFPYNTQPWDQLSLCLDQDSMFWCNAICNDGWQDYWFFQSEIDEACFKANDVMEPWDQWAACVNDLDRAVCSDICYFGHLDSWFWTSEITTACVLALDSYDQWDQCKYEQNAATCTAICFYGANDSWFWDSEVDQACKWMNAPDMTDSEIFYTNCQDYADTDWCMYSCIDGPNNTWYFDSEVEYACDNDDSYAGNYAQVRSRSKTRTAKENRSDKQSRKAAHGNALYFEDSWATYDSCWYGDDWYQACEDICYWGYTDWFFTAEEISQACQWITLDSAVNQYVSCIDFFDLGQCAAICFNGQNDPWFWQSEIDNACAVITAEDALWWADVSWNDYIVPFIAFTDSGYDYDWYRQHPTAKRGDMPAQTVPQTAVRAQSYYTRKSETIALATAGVQAESSSNAGYYIAGATLVGAAAVAFLAMKKKDEKVIEAPLLASDDGFKASM